MALHCLIMVLANREKFKIDCVCFGFYAFHCSLTVAAILVCLILAENVPDAYLVIRYAYIDCPATLIYGRSREGPSPGQCGAIR